MIEWLLFGEWLSMITCFIFNDFSNIAILFVGLTNGGLCIALLATMQDLEKNLK
jgi:hypothetical protein